MEQEAIASQLKLFPILLTYIGAASAMTAIFIRLIARQDLSEIIRRSVDRNIPFESSYKSLKGLKNIYQVFYIVSLQLLSVTIFVYLCFGWATLATSLRIDDSSFAKHFFVATGFCLGLVSIVYAWLHTEYRRFNDQFVELVSQFNKTNNSDKIDERKAIAKEFIYLLSEEKKMFLDYNIVYFPIYPNLVDRSPWMPYRFKGFLKKLTRLLNPYFWIFNLSYIFGLYTFVDSWKEVFVQFELSDQKSNLSEFGNFIFNKQLNKSGLSDLVSFCKSNFPESVESLYILDLKDLRQGHNLPASSPINQ